MIQLFAGHPEHRRGTHKNSANNYLPSALAALRIGDHRETSDLTKRRRYARTFPPGSGPALVIVTPR
jgi:hypothetical protein